MKATLSILTPNYNHAQYIGQAIEAVVSQSRLPDEYIIVDDASTDDSVKVIQSYVDRYPFMRLLRNECNLGVVRTVNRAMEAASGSHLLFSAADDYLLPGFLERAMNMAVQHPQAGIIFSGVEFLHADGHLGDVTGGFDWRKWNSSFYMTPKEFLERYVELEHPTKALSAATILQAEAFKEIGGYRELLETWSDTFSLRAMGLRHGACFAVGSGCVFRLLPGGYSSSSVQNPKRMLDLMTRAARLMRTPEFKDTFPEEHVRRWEDKWRNWVIEHASYEINRSYIQAGERYLDALKLNPPLFRRVGRSLMRVTGLFRRVQMLWLKHALRRYSGDANWPPVTLL